MGFYWKYVFHGFPRESAGNLRPTRRDDLPSPPERPPAHRSIAMGQRSCAVLRVWFIIKVPGWSWNSHASELRVWRSRLRDSGRSFRDWDFANCLNRKPRFPKFLISSAEREKKYRGRRRPLGSKDNTKGRSHLQQNDDPGYRGRGSPMRCGRQRLTLGPSPSPPFFAREKKTETNERNDAFEPYWPQ